MVYPEKRNFAILIKPTEVLLQTPITTEDDNKSTGWEIKKQLITSGTLLKIIESCENNTTSSSAHNNNSQKNVIIQVLDYYNRHPIWEQNAYKCSITNFKAIQEDILPYLIAIYDPEERLQLALNEERCKNVLFTRINDIVTVSGEPFRKNFNYDCIVRYIGLVPEIGPGYYFGLELLDLDHGYSPQTQDIPFVTKYVQCTPNLCLLLSANWLRKIDIKKKFSARDLFCGTLHRARSFLGIDSRSYNNNNNNYNLSESNNFNTVAGGSLRRSPERRKSFNEKRNLLSSERRQSSSLSSLLTRPQSVNLEANNSVDKKQFSSNGVLSLSTATETTGNFDFVNEKHNKNKHHKIEGRTNSKKSNIISVMDQKTLNKYYSSTSSTSSSTSTYASNSSGRKDKATNTASSHRLVDSSSNDKKDVNSGASNNHSSQQFLHHHHHPNLITLDNEDYIKYVENYEKSLERQQQDVPTVEKQNIPVSILKQSKTKKTTSLSSSAPPSRPISSANSLNGGGNNLIVGGISNSNNSNNVSCSSSMSVKPTTIMSLGDRDIVVIDKADINESTMNESEVIVLDNPPRHQKDIDLVDLLRGNWPSIAGDTAIILNNAPSTSVASTNTILGTTNAAAAGPTVVTISGTSLLPPSSSSLATLSAATLDATNKCNLNSHLSSSSNSSVSSSTYAAVSRQERNKSINPLSHLVSSRSLERQSKENARTSLHQSSTESNNSRVSFEANVNGKSSEKKLKNSSNGLYDNLNNSSSQVISLSPSDDEIVLSSQYTEIPGTNLGMGSMVEVSTDVCEDLYGVIKWIGCFEGTKGVMVGVELEDEPGERSLTLTDGTHNGIRCFKCPNGRALFVHPNQCSKDRRFQDIDLPHSLKNFKSNDSKMFGQMECPSISGSVPPLKIYNLDDLEEICGKFKGIQGHHNSCYLDATLFSMFTFTSVFDSLLYRPPEPEDIPHYEDVQKVLREEIVNPLRKNVFVRADKVMKLRQLLEKLSSVSGLTSEEKDPEEFLNSLLAQIMRADPFLKLSSGQDAFYYQLFVEKDERLSFPSVQQLFEQSFLASDIKLKEVPSCLIIQMPRFGKNFKMYPRILPSQVLDVTDIIEDSPRQCSVCGKLAEYECKECFGILQCGVGLESTAFCKKCLETVHSHVKRANHTPKEISVPQDFKIMAEHLTVPRLFMELFAVVCIETSHYVAFVKAGSGLDAPWCFFDSMADRKGEQNGYNIPEMVSVPDLPQWLSEEGARSINEAASNDKMLPEHAKRLLCDAYMCMYQSTDVMMYR